MLRLIILIFTPFAVLFSALFSAMSSSSSSSTRSVRKADENNNAGRIDSAEDKRARLDSSDEPAVASNVGDADGAPAAPGAAERHRDDHVVEAHASAARDARRTISEAAAAVAAESDHLAAAQRSARNARDRIRYTAKQEAAAPQDAAAQRSARNERDRIKYKANTQARVAEQKAVSRPSPGPHQPWPGRTPRRTRPTIWHGRPAMSAYPPSTRAASLLPPPALAPLSVPMHLFVMLSQRVVLRTSRSTSSWICVTC